MAITKISRNSFPHRFQLKENKGEECKEVFICGSSAELGAFETSKAIAMIKTQFGWTVDVRLSKGTHFYKYFKKHPVRGIIWEGESTRMIKETGAPRIVFPISADKWQDGASIPPAIVKVEKPVVPVVVVSSKKEIVKEQVIPLSKEEQEKLQKKREQKKKKKTRYLENKKKALTAQWKASMICFYCKKTGHPLSECPGIVQKQKNQKEKAERKAREKMQREAMKVAIEIMADIESESWKERNSNQFDRKFKSELRYKQYDIRKNKRQKRGGKEDRDHTRKRAQYLSPRLFMAL